MSPVRVGRCHRNTRTTAIVDFINTSYLTVQPNRTALTLSLITPFQHHGPSCLPISSVKNMNRQLWKKFCWLEERIVWPTQDVHVVVFVNGIPVGTRRWLSSLTKDLSAQVQHLFAVNAESTTEWWLASDLGLSSWARLGTCTVSQEKRLQEKKACLQG